MHLQHTATRSGRLSSFLRQELGLSAGLMNRLKWQNCLFVNDIARHADHLVQIGDVIRAELLEPEADYPAEDDPVTVLYEDEWLLAVEKPAGMLIHPSKAKNTGTLANRVLGYYRRTGQDCAFHPLTRLDRDTFGVVLLAKNSHIHGKLNELHSKGLLEKTYHALVYDVPRPQQGEICAPIARKSPPSLLREIREDGKPALTKYALLELCSGYSRIALQPVTGRTHQLRLHCAYRGFPILGDPQYGTKESLALSEKLGLRTQMLCAKTLRFPHPVTGELLQIVAASDVCV